MRTPDGSVRGQVDFVIIWLSRQDFFEVQQLLLLLGSLLLVCLNWVPFDTSPLVVKIVLAAWWNPSYLYTGRLPKSDPRNRPVWKSRNRRRLVKEYFTILFITYSSQKWMRGAGDNYSLFWPCELWLYRCTRSVVSYKVGSKVGDLDRGWTEASFFNSYYTEV